MIKAGISALITSILLAATASAEPARVLRAGEWESRIGELPARHICLRTDRTFDTASLAKITERTGMKCTWGDMNANGSIITYVATCDVAGGHMTLHSTITFDSPDVFITRSKSHYEGGKIAIPDMDMSQTMRWLGPCKPGDTESPE